MNHNILTSHINTGPGSHPSLIDSLHNSATLYHQIIEEVCKEFKRRDGEEARLRKLAEQAQQETNAWKQCYYKLLDQAKRGVYGTCTPVETPTSAGSDVDKTSPTTRFSTPVSLSNDIAGTAAVVPPLPDLVRETIYPPPVPRPPPAIIAKLKSLPRLCFDHYLSPHGCRFPGFITGKHSFHHDHCLNAEDIAGLRYIAQAFRCSKGQLCADPDCYFGHVCPGVCKGQGRGMKPGECTFLPEEHKEGASAWKSTMSKIMEIRAGRFGVRWDDKKVKDEGQRVGSGSYAKAPTTYPVAPRVSSPAKVAERVAQDLARVLEFNGPVGPAAVVKSGGEVRAFETSLLD
ncbi:hypothetical protein BGX38DRAFT_1144322 [Terfezia claveryi]|nr:hypothetical protein BGX38DRAFT_1144322 [Terfezia claveryi]